MPTSSLLKEKKAVFLFEDFLRRTELSKLLGIPISSVQTLLDHRKISSVRVGMAVWIPKSELYRLIEEGFRPAKKDK